MLLSLHVLMIVPIMFIPKEAAQMSQSHNLKAILILHILLMCGKNKTGNKTLMVATSKWILLKTSLYITELYKTLQQIIHKIPFPRSKNYSIGMNSSTITIKVKCYSVKLNIGWRNCHLKSNSRKADKHSISPIKVVACKISNCVVWKKYSSCKPSFSWEDFLE
jgi:hypothetical protein